MLPGRRDEAGRNSLPSNLKFGPKCGRSDIGVEEMWYLVPVVGVGGMLLTVMLLRLVDMWLNHEIGGGEFVLITGVLGWVGVYSWAK